MKKHDEKAIPFKENENHRPNTSESRRIPTPPDQNPTDAPLEEIEILESKNRAVLELTWRKSPCEPHPNGKLLVNAKVISGQSKADWRPKQISRGWA